MHRLSIAAILLSTLALPGCILAIGGNGHDRWHDGMTLNSDCDDCEMANGCPQLAHMQAQLDAMERHMQGECKPDCPYCKSAAAKDTKPANNADAKTPAPAKAKP